MSLHTVTEQDRSLAVYRHKNQTHKAGTGAKGKTFYSGATEPGKIVDSHRKDHFIFLLKPEVLIRIGREGLFFCPVTLQTFGAV